MTQRSNSHKLLIANRAEIAIRIAQAANELNIPTVSIYSEDDATTLHIRKTDEAVALTGQGSAAYLDADQIIAIAKNTGCTLIHPGYGFLSEQADFARRCLEAGLIFVGPTPETLEQLGHKSTARQLAATLDIPTLPGTNTATSLTEARDFLTTLGEGGAMMVKAIAGGGGRGMRVVTTRDQLDAAWARCQSEAAQAFGDDTLYVEQWLPQARHLEIQLIGDGTHTVTHLGERECSIQRHYQKLIEIAPAPGLAPQLRQRLTEAACRLGDALRLKSLGTIEFLVDGVDLNAEAPFYFIEANPRLQVEHTITEAITGIDLVQAQLQIAMGQTLADLDLTQRDIPNPNGSAMQLRINLESLDEAGNLQPGYGTLSAFTMPAGPGIRLDTAGYLGYQTSLAFDSLLAKLICHTPSSDFETLVRKSYRALCECHIAGVPTNITLLQNILQHPAFVATQVTTQFLTTHWQQIIQSSPHQELFVPHNETIATLSEETAAVVAPSGTTPILTPRAGSVISLDVSEGDSIQPGQPLAILEAMKMESVITAHVSGIVRQVVATIGQVLLENQPLLFIEEQAHNQAEHVETDIIDLEAIRPDLAEVFERRSFGLDENRPDAVEKRHSRGQRTARENVVDLCDPGTFVEYGSAIIAAQRTRRSLDDLIQRTPADGLITGFGAVNGELFDETTAQCLVMAYDYTVLAGTQGALNHKKMDRLLKLAAKGERPLILFAEGGGGRPGDVDYIGAAQLDVMTFTMYASLSGKIPLITIVSGYCFAGNAALAGCADLLIATENSAIGMGGPAMIEGGGLGRYHPKEVGPADVQAKNGVIDILVKDEAAAVVAAKKYLAYFQGPVASWSCVDQRHLRHLIPENRRRIYDIRQVITTLFDDDSVLELRPHFGLGMITALARIEGQPVGLIANNPTHLGGAIDSDGADKAARFMQLCNTHGLPIVALVDTPGIMVGPEAEASGTVRHASRLFVTGASLRVPYFAIILRKGYGLGAQVMCAGSFHVPFFTVAWPTGEFGAMGLEGAVRLGFRKELEAVENDEARQALFEKMVAKAYETGKALNTASFMELDEVIDPAESRQWIVAGLTSTKSPPSEEASSEANSHSFIDTW
ncbi:MAG: carboxyl transferase domain-containing protein [Chloroflexota bacterium]